MKLSTPVAIIPAVFLLSCSILVNDREVFQGTSMEPGIHDGDSLTVERFDGGGKFEVRRGDVIWFRYPEDPSKYYIKRLIGLPNETVEFREGAVFIDGIKLREPYLEPERNSRRDSQPPLVIKERHYYVLGDNRDASSDSRSWGLVPEELIIARVISR